jgi:hypothetical protein
MLKLNQEKLSIIALIICFIVVYISIQLLFGVFTQAYFWDELGVYSRSSIHQFQHGLSLLPSSTPDELSRGHPLLCPFYFAFFFKIFGCQPLVAHIAAALLNMLGFYFAFRILARYLNPFLACFATLSIFVQPAFLSQSVLILPEMPLMVCSLGAVWFYLNRQIILAMVFVILSLQIKESALIIPVAFLCVELLQIPKINWKNILLLVAIPFGSIALFFIIQKVQNGYFFYPLHTSLASFDMYFIQERWDSFKNFILYEQGHLIQMTILLALISVFLVVKRKDLLSLIKSKFMLIPIFIIGGIMFMVLNYFLSRYTIYYVVFIYILLFSLSAKISSRHTYGIIVLSLLIGTVGVYNWNTNKKYTDSI